MSAAVRKNLTALARSYGVQTSYEDVDNVRRNASIDTLFLVTRALGARLDSPDDAASALRDRIAAFDRDAVEPVHVAWGGRLPYISMRLTRRTAAQTVRWTLRLEDGTARTGDASPQALASRSPGQPTHRVKLVTTTLPFGYHDLEVETAGGVLTSRIIASPRRAHALTHDTWGVFAPLYALLAEGDSGIATYSDMERLARWTAARGGSFVGTLPLLPTFLDAIFEPSPYAPVSRLFWNELYVDVTRAPGYSPELAERPLTTNERFVDYRAVAATRLGALRAAAANYFASGDTSDVDRFTAAHAHALDYARFRAVLERRRESWHVWPDRLRAGTVQEGDYAEADVHYHLYAQWQADEQLGRIALAADRDAAALYLDLPLGVHPDGYDAWRERALFADGASTGAPPDKLFTGGQDWGFRPPDPHAQRVSGHRYFIESIRHHLRHAKLLRLDHVMSLYRLYWVPAGLDARSGAYVRYPAEELFAILALESVRHNAAVVGEDLGTVPRAVRQIMQRRGIMRMFVLQYELSPDSADTIASVPRDVVAGVNTHDMPTFAGFLAGSEIDDQLDLDLIDAAEHTRSHTARKALTQRLARRVAGGSEPRELYSRVLNYLAESPAKAVVVNLEDLWLEPQPQNVPGTSSERPNWRRRMSRTLESMMEDKAVLNTLATIDRARSTSHAQVAEG